MAEDPVRAQIDPRAHRILGLAGFFVQPGFRPDPDGVERFAYGPKYRGVPLEVWARLHRDRPAEFWELVSICERHFPTWCALLGKVVQKGGGRPGPFILNKPQRRVVQLIASLIERRLALWMVLLKARQEGITTLVALFQYWQNWRKPNVQCLFLGDKSKLLERRVQIVNATHDAMPDIGNLRPVLRADNRAKGGKLPKSEIFFMSRGSAAWHSGTDTIVAKNPSAVLGFQGTHVSCSEAAFWCGHGNDVLFSILEALTPQLPQRGSPNYLQSSVMVESTPNSMNDFRDLYDENKDPEMENRKWHTLVLPWWIHDDEFSVEPPEDWEMEEAELIEQARLTKLRMIDEGLPVTRAQMYWRSLTIRDECGGDSETFDVWYLSDDVTCFRAASGSVFKSEANYLRACVERIEATAPAKLAAAGWPIEAGDDALVGTLEFDPLPTPFGHGSRLPNGQTKKQVDFVPSRKGALSLWETPQPGHIYTIGGDCSGGTGNDGACAHIACATCGVQAGELYNSWLDPNAFADQCVHLGWWYNNALFNPEVNALGSAVLKRSMSDWGYPMMCQDEAWDEPRLKLHKFGFSSGEHTKPVMINYARGMITERHYRISSRGLLREMANFYYLGLTSSGEQRSGGGRAGNAHDDRVLAWALAMWAVRQTPAGVRSDFETRRFPSPNAVQLGLNQTVQHETFLGKGISEGEYDGMEVPERISRLFDMVNAYDDVWDSSCPLKSGWQAASMGLSS